MEFTREAWENAPKGATLEFNYVEGYWKSIHIVGFTRSGDPVIENESGVVLRTLSDCLRIVLPKRKVTVQLWRVPSSGREYATVGKDPVEGWTLLGEHTFEIEGE